MSSDRISKLSKPLSEHSNLTRLFSDNLLDEANLFLASVNDAVLKGQARITGDGVSESHNELLKRFSFLPEDTTKDPSSVFRNITNHLFSRAPLWRSPSLQYNVGAPVNAVSSILYGTAMDLNIFNINDGLSGNAIVAEHAVIRILAELAGLDPNSVAGFFTFGGTATNLYALKLALQKNIPGLRTGGLSTKVKVALTADAHFSHFRILDWLSIGTDNALVLAAQNDHTTDVLPSRAELEEALSNGFRIPLIILNGGTTYDHAIDNIADFVQLRNDLVEKYKLDYVPHIHADSVIGWPWLFFRTYDFEKNPLEIEEHTLKLINQQVGYIEQIRLADSWGVDFHKGVGSCPIPASVIMINDRRDLQSLTTKKLGLHQLASEYSTFSPVDFTLESSRPAGAPLAALGALHALGTKGFQTHLAILIQSSQLFRELIASLGREDIQILNPDSRGYVTMLRLHPAINTQEKDNTYLKSFFEFDKENRMKQGDGVEYSYTSQYTVDASGKNSDAIKFYPTSPLITSQHVEKAVETLVKQKELFDQTFFNYQPC